MAAAVAMLRGGRLKEHLLLLSQSYQWSAFGTSVEVGPKSVTKRRRAPRPSMVIQQTPLRALRVEEFPGESPPEKINPVFATKTPGFLALKDESSDESSEEFDDEEDVPELVQSLNRLDIVEYIPIPNRPVLTEIAVNVVLLPKSLKADFSTAAPPAPRTPHAEKPSSKEKKVTTDSVTSGNYFKRQRCKVVAQLFAEYNTNIFGSQLPSDLTIKWNKRLLTTAGITKLRLSNQNRVAVVELSEKVVDDMDRLKNTLLHELCHAAAWIVDAERRPPHGKQFWKWASAATKIEPGQNISTCHSYIIHKPYRYRCTNNDCNFDYSRHSKSIDVERHRCGACRSTLEFVGKVDISGTPVVPKKNPAGGFAAFVSANFAKAKVKLNSPKAKTSRDGKSAAHFEIMQTLSAWYSEHKKADIKKDVPSLK